jgi:hypothetical protein
MRLTRQRVVEINIGAELGAPGGTRTPDQELRRLLLYPAELQALGQRAVYMPQFAILL